MITGDYHHTAIAVAKNVGMLPADRDIVVIDAVQQCQPSPPSSPRRVAFVSPSPDQSPAPLHLSPSRLRSTSLRSALMSPGHAAAPSVIASSFSRPCGATQAAPADALEHASSSAFLGKAHGAQHGASNGSPHEQLRFVRGLAGEEVQVGPSEAMTAMVSGEVQCAVTGSAFDHILHISDVSVLETVMRSVLVFARMKPHQKGEVMDLLSVRGVHQMHQGQPRHLQVTPLLLCLSHFSQTLCVTDIVRVCVDSCMYVRACVYLHLFMCVGVCACAGVVLLCMCSSFCCICFHVCLRCVCECLYAHAYVCICCPIKKSRTKKVAF